MTAIVMILLRNLVPAACGLAALATPAAWADHPGSGTARGGVGIGLGWLFFAGIVLVVVLAAWAMFAPERPDPREDDAP
jgi:hypothetical protein